MAKKTRRKNPEDADGLRDELGLAVTARRELGAQYDDEVVEALAERIDSLIDKRVQAALRKSRKQSKSDAKTFLAVALPTMGIGIPLLAVGAGAVGPGRLLRRARDDLSHQRHVVFAFALVGLPLSRGGLETCRTLGGSTGAL